MAAAKKYAGLPDLDIAAPEIYETPDLTEGGSTAPTATIRTDSPFASDAEGDERLDHQRLDPDSARRRFEPAIVDAKNVNFGDTVNPDERISYSTRSRRRRRAAYLGTGSDDESDEEESLGARIARLKREALEVQLELEKRKEGGGPAESDTDTANGVDELGKLLSGLNASSSLSSQIGARDHVERAFLKNLSNANKASSKDAARKPVWSSDRATTVSISPTVAIADFSDRLTALESALGLSTVDATSQASAILPTLNSLSEQISTLNSIIAPLRGSATSTAPASLPNLDALQSRIHQLTAEADKLSASRKAALASLDELHETRLRYSTIRHNRTHSRPTSSHNGPLQELDRQESQLHSGLFLQEQASKITALYQLLPTIQGLQPLLPTVLERLRSLSVIHAGAAEARGELDDVIRRQDESREDIKKWRAAVESVEKKMAEMSGQMKENVDEVGGVIGGLEERIKVLASPR